jgi:hypothetical protein
MGVSGGRGKETLRREGPRNLATGVKSNRERGVK